MSSHIRQRLPSTNNRVVTLSTSHLEEDDEISLQNQFNLVPGVEVVSYLPFQISLYFNVYYSICWIVTLIVALEAKFSFLLDHYKYTTVAVYVVMFSMEILRLYLGYEGNLREKVAELAGFWLLSLFQLPLVIYLMCNINTVILPIEWAINIPLVLFLVVQICTGFRALQRMVSIQAIKYQVSLLQPRLTSVSQEGERDHIGAT